MWGKTEMSMVKVKFHMLPARYLSFKGILRVYCLQCFHTTSAKIYHLSDALVLRPDAGDASFAPWVFDPFLGLPVP